MYENWWKGNYWVFQLFHGVNIQVRLPKDKPRALEEDPYSLMQHYLEVCINGTKDLASVY